MKFTLVLPVVAALLLAWHTGIALAQEDLSGATAVLPATSSGAVATVFTRTLCLPEEQGVQFQFNNGFYGFTPLNFRVSIDCGDGSRNTMGYPSQAAGDSELHTIHTLLGGVRNKRCPLVLYGLDPSTLEQREFDSVVPDCGPVSEDDDDDDDGCEYDDDDANDCGPFELTCEVQKQELLTTFLAWGPAYLVLVVAIGVRLLIEFFRSETFKNTRRVEALKNVTQEQAARDIAAFNKWQGRRARTMKRIRAVAARYSR